MHAGINTQSSPTATLHIKLSLQESAVLADRELVWPNLYLLQPSWDNMEKKGPSDSKCTNLVVSLNGWTLVLCGQYQKLNIVLEVRLIQDTPLGLSVTWTPLYFEFSGIIWWELSLFIRNTFTKERMRQHRRQW
jgi:hypothetical protein